MRAFLTSKREETLHTHYVVAGNLCRRVRFDLGVALSVLHSHKTNNLLAVHLLTMYCSFLNIFTPSLSSFLLYISLTSSDTPKRKQSFHNLPLSFFFFFFYRLCMNTQMKLLVFVCVFCRLGAWWSPGELILSSSRLIYLLLLLLFITSHYKLFGNLIGHTDK